MENKESKIKQCKTEVEQALEKYNCILTAQVLLGNGYSQSVVKIVEKEDPKEEKE